MNVQVSSGFALFYLSSGLRPQRVPALDSALTLGKPLLAAEGRLAGEGSLLWVYGTHIANAPKTNGALL